MNQYIEEEQVETEEEQLMQAMSIIPFTRTIQSKKDSVHYRKVFII
ncbi:hypothetical protein [Bacillus solitudinis]|nr:hypothetical protein [Bacillus solitudinis]